MQTWIDVHTHINMLEISPEEALQSAEAQSVRRMITIGTCPNDLPIVLGIGRRFFPRVACTLGIHPHEAQLYDEQTESFIRANASAKEVVAIGETGLDYYYDHGPRDLQMAAFRAQMNLAQETGLPVEIHTREADADTAQVLKDFSGVRKGLLHCFTSSWDLAKVGLDCGYDISISGVVTFKNAQALRDLVKQVPLDRLHIETDAPFLAPIPHRGKKNQPAFVTHVAEQVAAIKGVSLEQLSEQLYANARVLFPKLNLAESFGRA